VVGREDRGELIAGVDVEVGPGQEGADAGAAETLDRLAVPARTIIDRDA